jgi:hypothetical protein
MPSVFTLEGTRGSLRGAPLGDNALVSWLRTQNPLVAGVVGVSLALGIGVVVSQMFISAHDRFRR